MGIRYQIDPSTRTLVFELSGAVGLSDFLEGFALLENDARMGRGFRQLFDMTDAEIDLGDSSGTDFVQAVSSSVRQNPLVHASKLALVAPQPHQFGLLRMYEMTNEEAGPVIRVFWNRAEAEAWLNEPDGGELDS